jgi:diguanylate cyclase (GGDEF)-like protein
MQGLVQEALGKTLSGVTLEISAQAENNQEKNASNQEILIFNSREYIPLENSNFSALHLEKKVVLNMGGNQIWELKFTGLPRNFKPLSWWSGEILVVILICLTSVFGVVLITLLHLSSQRLMKLTKELQASEERYQFMATHDALTKVGNRALFHSSLENMLLQAERHHFCFAVIYIDLDKFKAVNDTLGHNYGDMLLIQVTERVKSVIRKSDLLARNGGDEFVILLGRLQEPADSQRIAKKVCAVLAKPFTLEDQVVGIAGSLGIAVYPNDAKTVEDIVNCADSRMYLAKKAGGNRYVFADKT